MFAFSPPNCFELCHSASCLPSVQRNFLLPPVCLFLMYLLFTVPFSLRFTTLPFFITGYIVIEKKLNQLWYILYFKLGSSTFSSKKLTHDFPPIETTKKSHIITEHICMSLQC